MKFLELFTGSQGTILASLILLPLFILMWLISIKLFKRRRKESYLTLAVALLLTLLNHAGSIWLELARFLPLFVSNEVWLHRSVTAVGNIAFILLMLGFYQLYHLTADRIRWSIYALSFASMGIAILNGWNEIVFKAVLLILIWIVIGGRVGTDHKFRWAISTFFLTEALRVWVEQLQHQTQAWSLVSLKIMPVFSYSILFFILLERVIEVMQKSYMKSITDALTGVYNRAHFYEAVKKAVYTGQSVTVIFIDIDNFKRANDTYGHKVGDDLLIQVSGILREEVEGYGMAARYGGEELVALIRNASIDMKQLTERIRFRIEKETNPGVTASIGYSKLENAVAFDRLIQQADQAMYRAKTTGKNKVVKFVSEAS